MQTIDKIINNINALVAAKNISKAELARRAGMKDPAQLHNILSGRNSPGLEVLERIAAALGVSLADLMGDKVPKGSVTEIERLRLEAIKLILVADDDGIEAAIIALKGSAAGKKLNTSTRSRSSG